MSTAYDYWVHLQEEPTDVVTSGNYKRHKELPLLMEVWKSIEVMHEIEKKYPAPLLTNQEKIDQADKWLEDENK